MVCFCLMPLLVYKLLDPELKRTPEAKAMGKQALGELGSMSSNEKKVAFGFVLALVGWGTSLITGLSATSVGLGWLLICLLRVLLAGKVCLMTMQPGIRLSGLASLLALRPDLPIWVLLNG